MADIINGDGISLQRNVKAFEPILNHLYPSAYDWAKEHPDPTNWNVW